MNHNLIIRIITLSGFLLLVAAFIFYRTGKIELSAGTRNNIDDIDTIPKDDTNESLRLSSSKTLILVDPSKKFADSQKGKQNVNSFKPGKEKDPLYLVGSKSARIFTKDDLFALDTVKMKRFIDSVRATRKTQDSLEKNKE